MTSRDRSVGALVGLAVGLAVGDAVGTTLVRPAVMLLGSVRLIP